MDKVQRNTLVTIIIVSVISIGIIVGFSIPLGIFPPIGELLFPGNGLWLIEEDVASEEIITSDYLSEDVTVLRDQWGIPHIYGSNEEDILYALGYVQAQDRLFQMDMAKRATQGKLAEILGLDMLDTDKMALTKLMTYWTEETVKEMKASSDPVDQQVMNSLEAFSQGVNYYIDTIKALPLEFQFLGFQPDYWTPKDTFSFIKFMSEMLTWDYSDFINILIEDALGMEAYQELFGYPLPYQIPITTDYGTEFEVDIEAQKKEIVEEINEIIVSLSKQVYEQIKEIPREKQFLDKVDVKGSNNWAISGNKTSTDLPFLSNDMHLSFNLPGIWYEAHLININPLSDFNVYGFFLTGVPFPIVGHNAYVGWGMTNTAYDVIDWYHYERINETHYWYKGKAVEYTIINYEIKVKGQDPELFQVKSTVHGPVFSDFIGTEGYSIYPDKVISCQWISQSVTYEARAIYGFIHSKNRADFNEALKYFSTPAQNIIYADIHGDIGIRPTGKVPIRNDTGIPTWHFGNGSMTYNGSDGQGEWIGLVPFEDLPHSENPTQGYVLSANQIVAGPEYLKNYSLQNPIEISNGYRARRIDDLLSTNNDITLEDMKSFILDIYSTKASNFSLYLLDLVASITTKTSLQQNAFVALASWDFLQEKESYTATIFNLWLEIYRYETFVDDVVEIGSPRIPQSNVLEWFTKNNASSHWFDNITTPEIEKRDDIILLAFNKALSGLTTYFGTEDITQWQWGNLHQLEIDHLTGLSALGFEAVPVDGTGDTISPFSGYRLWDGEKVVSRYCGSGASERMIIDFSNLNNSISIIPSGQRGISNSNHFIDQLLIYLEGEFHTQYFGADTIEGFKISWIESKILFMAQGD